MTEVKILISVVEMQLNSNLAVVKSDCILALEWIKKLKYAFLMLLCKIWVAVAAVSSFAVGLLYFFSYFPYYITIAEPSIVV